MTSEEISGIRRALSLALLVASVSAAAAPLVHVSGAKPGEYVVLLQSPNGATLEERGRFVDAFARYARAQGGQVVDTWRRLSTGIWLRAPESVALRIARDGRVLRVVENAPIHAQARESVAPGAPWGRDRIDQRNLPLDGYYAYGQAGQGVNVYILDTGFDGNDPELTGRVGLGVDVVGDGQGGSNGEMLCSPPAEHFTGHGRAIAETLGGSTLGVAKLATLHSVRMLPCTAVGTVAAAKSGLEWVDAHKVLPAVANLSWSFDGTTADWLDLIGLESDTQTLIDHGVIVVAAVNDGGTPACGDTGDSPGRMASVIAVGATIIQNGQDVVPVQGGNQSGAGWGPCIDLNAPDTGTDQFFNGSSFSTAYTSGVAALLMGAFPWLVQAEVSTLLTSMATPNLIQGLQGGTPNLLLFSRWGPMWVPLHQTVSCGGFSCASTCPANPIGQSCVASGVGATCQLQINPPSGTTAELYQCGQANGVNTIDRIRVTGSAASGAGSNLSGWWVVNNIGGAVRQISSGPTAPPGLGTLFSTTDWSAPTSSIQAGERFALVGSEGSNATTRTFEFFDAEDNSLGTRSVGSYDTGQMVRSSGFPAIDVYTEFQWSGTTTSSAQRSIPAIASIRITGTAGSGGGSALSGWHLVSSGGTDQGTISGGFGDTLCHVTDWTVTLSTPITPNQTFALVGSEGCTAVSRQFQFYDQNGNLLTSTTIGPFDTARAIRGSTFPTSDEFTLFTWNGSSVTASQRVLGLISQITVTGPGGSGGGSNVSGWYLLTSSGGNLGAISSGLAQPLFYPINWTVNLSTPIQLGQYFGIVGSEGSTAVSRTFTFYDGYGNLLRTLVVGPYDSARMVRYSGFSSGDEFTRFQLGWDGVISAAQVVSP